jgi:hypothetical protein
MRRPADHRRRPVGVLLLWATTHTPGIGHARRTFDAEWVDGPKPFA